jgi:cytochrome c553
MNRGGSVRTDGHPFFEALGTNGRACVTCHQPSNAMSVSAASLRERWTETEGRDPVFAAVDGSNCPDLPQAAMISHSLLLSRGLFRISLPWPPKAADGTAVKPEFRIEVVSDPAGCNTGAAHGIESANRVVSVYRRPRVAGNLDRVIAGPEGTSFMSDAREPSLRTQAVSAIMVHEQAKTPPTAEQLRRIVDFETQIYVAQSADIRGGLLNEKGGPAALGPENLEAGKAGSLGDDIRARLAFAVWRKPEGARDLGLQHEFRASVARGSDVFFDRTFRTRDAVTRTCAACHTAGTTRWMDIGTTNLPAAKESSDLPLFRITCDATALPHPLLGRVIYTQDPGRGLITGKCADVGSIVLQQLRGLAARSPYFSNVSAGTLRDVVDFYDHSFGIGYSEREKVDLVNFLSVL